MRKWLIIVGFVVLAGLIISWLLIPSVATYSGHATCSANPAGMQRVFIGQSDWNNWWPGSHTGDNWNYDHHNFRIKEKKLSSLILEIESGPDSILSNINLFPQDNDSVIVEWVAAIPISTGIFSRFTDYIQAKKLFHDIDVLLGSLRDHYSKLPAIYGTDIKQVYVADSILVSTYDSSHGYPTTAQIYTMIDSLKQFTDQQQAKVTGLPMLNINTADSMIYNMRVALPVDRRLPTAGRIEYRWMMGGGRILVTEVKGGKASIAAGLKQLQLYMSDHHRIAAAIPFQSLVTDRRNQPDSSQWITRLFYPVM